MFTHTKHRVHYTFSVGLRAFRRLSPALERRHSAHIDSRLPVRRWRRRRRIWPLPRVLYPASVGVQVSFLTVSWFGQQRLSRRRFSWKEWSKARRSFPLQGNRVGRDFHVQHRVVDLPVCCKERTWPMNARCSATRSGLDEKERGIFMCIWRH